MRLTSLPIVRKPDKYIAGQNESQRKVALALHNHRRCMSAKGEIRNKIVPNNILMIGGAGVGHNAGSRVLDLTVTIRTYKKQQPE